MAENINVPYADIVKAAAIPAILYYVTAFWMVHLEAGRKNLTGLPREQCPNPWHAMRDNWYPLLALIAAVHLALNLAKHMTRLPESVAAYRRRRRHARGQEALRGAWQALPQFTHQQ